MIAVVVATASVSLLAGIVTLIGLAVLVAHLASPKVKRLVGATLVAVVLAVLLARAEEFIFLDPCARHEPWSVMWIFLGCFLP